MYFSFCLTIPILAFYFYIYFMFSWPFSSFKIGLCSYKSRSCLGVIVMIFLVVVICAVNAPSCSIITGVIARLGQTSVFYRSLTG